MRTFSGFVLLAALAAAGCGKGQQPKALGAVGNNTADNASQSGSVTDSGAGATSSGNTGEGGGGVGPARTSEHPGGGTPTGSD
jgi:hypothetical protein